MLQVRAVVRMTEHEFWQHLNLRHVPCGDWTGLTSLRGGQAFLNNAVVYKVYHRWLHREFEYDHEHA